LLGLAFIHKCGEYKYPRACMLHWIVFVNPVHTVPGDLPRAKAIPAKLIGLITRLADRDVSRNFMPTAIKNLNNQDALEAALVAAKDYRQQTPIEIKLHDDQGCYALTFAVKYADNTESIIQLKDTPIDTTVVQLARKLLGDIVPNVDSVTATHRLRLWPTENSGGKMGPIDFFIRGRRSSDC
jgi:hypothetical protein